MAETWTLKRMLDWGADYFAKNQVESPRLAMEQLLSHVLKKKRIDLYVEFERALTPQQLVALKPLIQRRAKREPLQYVLGEAAFCSTLLKVSPAVLIPRPETELLIERVIAEAKRRFGAPPVALRIVDLGTGSGNIAIALAHEFPQADVFAVDISEEALALAQENATVAGAQSHLHFLHGDWFDALANLNLPPAHLIVSNPPYVSEKEFAELAPEVRDHEPRCALVAGPTGLEMYERIIPQVSSFLVEGGVVAFEVGKGQARRVEVLLKQHRLRDISIAQDLAGIERIVLGVRG